MTSKRPQCWECLRRESPCDGKTPVCGNCSAAGMVCPGYNNSRPLTWLPTGKVSRLQKVKIRPGGAAPARPPRRSPGAIRTPKLTPERGASVSSTPPRSLGRKAKTSSDRGSDAGTLSDASPGTSTSSLVAAVRKTIIRGGYDKDEDGDSRRLSEGKSSTLQLVADKGRFGSANGARSMPVVPIPPDLRPEQWDFVDAIQYCMLLFHPLFVSYLRSHAPICMRQRI